MRPFAWFIHQIEGQRGFLFPWAAVLYGTGVAFYFSLRFEPDQFQWAGLALCAAICLGLLVWAGPVLRLCLIAVLLVSLGAMVAGWRAHSAASAVLDFRYYGPIQGRIVAIDRSASDAVRLTLDRVVLRDVARTPERVRVSMHGRQGFFTPEPGLTVMMTGHLSPPGGAVEPGGYDFRRHAWFQGLGAVGYTRTPVLALLPHEGRDFSLWLYRLRMKISQGVQAALPGSAGPFAAAITTGDRSGLDRAVLDDLRAANLAHLLAISGLHMGLLTGLVFGALRVGLAHWSLFWPTRRIAAAGALVAGAIYLALSGGNVATERAFIMVAVMLVAVLTDRRAITLRAVAVAAIIVLTLRPEAIYGPGFQMSFAATTALVFVFGLFRNTGSNQARWPRWLRFAIGVALSSFVAGIATAPIAAAHFNQVPHYGLIANVVSVPLMGAIIIPGAVLAALLAPLGLAWVGLAVMKWPILWILWVAETVASWPGALSFIVTPQAFVLPAFTLAALWLVIWQGSARALGVPVAALVLVLWSMADRPKALVSQTGGLVGVMTDAGRALSKAKGDGFSADSWLENDGDPVEQVEAATRVAFDTDGRIRRFQMGAVEVVHATGKVAAAQALEECNSADVLVVNVVVTHPDGCVIYDLARLRREGALALSEKGNGVRVTTVRDVSGDRLWSR